MSRGERSVRESSVGERVNLLRARPAAAGERSRIHWHCALQRGPGGLFVAPACVCRAIWPGFILAAGRCTAALRASRVRVGGGGPGRPPACETLRRSESGPRGAIAAERDVRSSPGRGSRPCFVRAGRDPGVRPSASCVRARVAGRGIASCARDESLACGRARRAFEPGSRVAASLRAGPGVAQSGMRRAAVPCADWAPASGPVNAFRAVRCE